MALDQSFWDGFAVFSCQFNVLRAHVMITNVLPERVTSSTVPRGLTSLLELALHSQGG